MSVLNQTIAYFKQYMEQNIGVQFKSDEEAAAFLAELLQEKAQA